MTACSENIPISLGEIGMSNLGVSAYWIIDHLSN